MTDPLKLLNALHSLSAVDEERAVEVNYLSKLLGIEPKSLQESLKLLHEMRYVRIRGSHVHLTELGILKINSTFC